MRRISGVWVKRRAEPVSVRLTHTHTGSAALCSAHWQACLLGLHLTTRKTASLSTSWSRLHFPVELAYMAASQFMRFYELHFTAAKVAGANCSASISTASSHLEWSGLCFFFFFLLLPILWSARGETGCRCMNPTSDTMWKDFVFDMECFLSLFLFAFLHLWFQIHLCCLASTPVGCNELSNEQSRGVCWQLGIRERKTVFWFPSEQLSTDTRHPKPCEELKDDAALQELEHKHGKKGREAASLLVHLLTGHLELHFSAFSNYSLHVFPLLTNLSFNNKFLFYLPVKKCEENSPFPSF